MIATIGSWVYVLSTALVVVAFMELLVPRSAATGLVRVVVGLCVIALLLDIALNLVSDGLEFDLESGLFSTVESPMERRYASAGEALASGTLAVIGLGPDSGEASVQSSGVTLARESRSSNEITRIYEVLVEAIAEVKAGDRRD